MELRDAQTESCVSPRESNRRCREKCDPLPVTTPSPGAFACSIGEVSKPANVFRIVAKCATVSKRNE